MIDSGLCSNITVEDIYIYQLSSNGIRICGRTVSDIADQVTIKDVAIDSCCDRRYEYLFCLCAFINNLEGLASILCTTPPGNILLST